jgi:hypothetical protein
MKETMSPTAPKKKTIQKEEPESMPISTSQILIALACIFFFPLLYLIGSTIVSLFQHP